MFASMSESPKPPPGSTPSDTILTVSTSTPESSGPQGHPGKSQALQIYRESIYLLREYNKLLRTHFRDYVTIFLGILTQVAFYIQFPLVFKYIFDQAIPQRNFGRLGIAAVEILALLVVGWVGSFVQTRYMSRVGGLVLAQLRADMVTKLHKLPLSFYANMEPVDLLSRFSNDAERVENSMTRALPFLVESVMVTLGCLVTIAFIDWHLAIAAAVLLPIGFIGNLLLGPREAATNSESRRLKNSMLSTVETLLDSWLIIRAFGERRLLNSRFEHHNDQYTRASSDYSYYINIMPVFADYAVNASLAIIVVIGAVIAMEGGITTGAFIGCFALLRKVADGSAKSARYFSAFHNAIRPFRRIQTLLSEPEIPGDYKETTNFSRLNHEISFDGVSAGYSPGTDVVRDLHFSFKVGTSVAFVGPSGSGKSTILKLIMRIIEPQMGSIRLDGIDLRQLPADTLRKKSGIVLQESHVFKGTIAENIRFGKPDATDQEVMEAAKRAECHDWIMSLTKGYDHPIDEKAGSLSGGQRQRIALARAFIQDAVVMLLDEPTSMLDPITEDQVNDAIRHRGQGRTVVMCTHRLALSRHFDKIIVVDKGRVVEAGNHDELIALGGMYSRLWEKQHGFHSSPTGFVITPERLRAIPIFSSLSLEDLGRLADEFSTETFDTGSIIIQQGSTADRFYVAVRGLVEVAVVSPGGSSKIVAQLGAGDHFGEIALLRAVPRTATIKALSHTTCLTLTRNRFLRLVEGHPELLEALEKAMETRK
jgi:ATP-binding cassette, subfamily B, bacterial